MLHHQSWSTEEGLPQNSVHAILQTADGFLWIATEGGLARFDGTGFRVFQHATDPPFTSDDLCCLAETASGDLWIGTADGLLRLRRGIFRRFAEPDGLPSATIRSLAPSPNGSLAVLTADGLANLDNESFHPLTGPAANPETLIPAAQSDQGGPWLLAENGLFRIQNGREEAQPSPHAPTLLAQGSANALWTVATTAVTLQSSAYPRIWRTGSNLPGTRIQSLAVDRAARAWVGTNDGLAVLTASSTHATVLPDLRGNTILAIFPDREGNLWIGSETTGLHVLRALKFRAESTLAGKSLTAAIAATDGSLWVGTREDGLRRIRNIHGPTTDSDPVDASAEEPAPARTLTSPFILSLAPGLEGSIWAGTPDGLNHIAATGQVRRITSADGLPDDYIQTLAAAPDGSVWIGTRRGLAHLADTPGGPRIDTFTRADGLGSDLIGALLLASTGDLWIATSGGLSRRSPGGTISNASTQPFGIVTAMVEDSQHPGAVWLATRAGTLTLSDGHAFRPIPEASAALAGRIDALAAAPDGSLWLRNQRTLVRLRLPVCPTACPPEITRFGLADGLPSEEAVPGGTPLLSISSTGELLVPTRRGLALADTAHLPFNPVPPPVAIERLLVDDTPVDTDAPQIEIPFGHTRLTVEYAALSFTVPAEVRFRYLLEGFDRAWTDAGNRRSATYTNLPPGRFRFRLQAANNDGVWNETGATLAFRIVPPFYRRWWFYLLAALLVAALAAALYRLRLRRLQTRFDAVLQERNRMAREIHDTLAQDFVGVSIQLDIVAQLLGIRKVEAALAQVQQTRKLVTDGLADARQSIWQLRANTARDSLPSRLKAIAERFSTPSLPIRLTVTGAFRPLGSPVEDEVLRIAQEALSNVQRHAQATSASIELRYETSMLVLTVADDGRGFAPEAATPGHYGLSGLRERAALLLATLDLTSSAGAGTTVRLAVPIAAAKE